MKRIDEAQDATQTVGEKVPHGFGSLHIPSLQAGGGRGQSLSWGTGRRKSQLESIFPSIKCHLSWGRHSLLLLGNWQHDWMCSAVLAAQERKTKKGGGGVKGTGVQDQRNLKTDRFYWLRAYSSTRGLHGKGLGPRYEKWSGIAKCTSNLDNAHSRKYSYSRNWPSSLGSILGLIKVHWGVFGTPRLFPSGPIIILM